MYCLCIFRILKNIKSADASGFNAFRINKQINSTTLSPSLCLSFFLSFFSIIFKTTDCKNLNLNMVLFFKRCQKVQVCHLLCHFVQHKREGRTSISFGFLNVLASYHRSDQSLFKISNISNRMLEIRTSVLRSFP